jgi:hypothetical protein
MLVKRYSRFVLLEVRPLTLESSHVNPPNVASESLINLKFGCSCPHYWTKRRISMKQQARLRTLDLLNNTHILGKFHIRNWRTIPRICNPHLSLSLSPWIFSLLCTAFPRNNYSNNITTRTFRRLWKWHSISYFFPSSFVIISFLLACCLLTSCHFFKILVFSQVEGCLLYEASVKSVLFRTIPVWFLCSVEIQLSLFT